MIAIVKNIKELQAKTGLNLVATYLVMFVVSALVIWVAAALFPGAVVLGTAAHTPLWALCLASGKLALITTAVMPFVTYREWKMKRDFTPRDWMMTYFVVDVLALWIVSRYAKYLGLGLSSWMVVVLLGAALDWVQGMAMMAYGKLTGQEVAKN